jgi:hypothetical protein
MRTAGGDSAATTPPEPGDPIMSHCPATPGRTAAILCLALLLAACSRPADDSTSTEGAARAATPPPMGQAGGGHATTATEAGAPGDAPGDASSPASGDAPALPSPRDGGDTQASDDWPALRDVPAGVLAWTVVYDGTGTTRTSELKEVATLHRELHGTAHMSGGAGNPDEAPPATPMDGINAAMQACGDDMACQQAAAMKAVALARKDPGALERGMRTAMTEAQRDTTWGAASCKATVVVNDRATWSGMTPGGYNTGVGTRIGKRAIDDCSVDRRPSLVADDNSRTYTLALPAVGTRVDRTLGGRPDPVPSNIELPALLVQHIRYDRLDRPLRGSITLHTGSDSGVWSEGWKVPLTEKISWTFTPEAH